MDQSIKEKWVEALRSGDYEQGTGALRQKDEKNGTETFCCLGVLCDLVDRGDWTDYGGFYDYKYKGEREANVLPSTLAEDFDTGEEPAVRVTKESGRKDWVELTILNDGMQNYKQRSFEEIADLIERSL